MESTEIQKFLMPGDKSILKRVEYEGGLAGKKGEVAYKVRGNLVFFTAIRSSREAPSTVNSAEEVVIAICEAEGINWRNPSFYTKYKFYDLSTPIGYPGRKESPYLFLTTELGEVQIDELEIVPREDYIHVRSWTPVYLNLENSRLTLESRNS